MKKSWLWRLLIDGIRLVSIFGDQKFLKAHIHSLALVDHNIFLKE
jgi:predicted RNA-binding protein